MTPRAWIEIDLAALVHNAGVLRRAIPRGTRLGLLVKANAYGHGIEQAARAAVVGGADQLIVANVEEGFVLRKAGIERPVLVAYPAPADAVGEAVAAGLELTVGGRDSTRRTLEAWAGEMSKLADRTLTLHVEVDTGMGRGGVAPDDLLDVVQQINADPAINLASIWSHLAAGRDADVAAEQTRRYESALEAFAATGQPLPPRHLVATEAMFASTAPTYEMVRIGLGFYGELGVDFQPATQLAALAAELRPAMTVKARPVRLEQMAEGADVGYGQEWRTERPSVIATLPIGYADGWSRKYWPGAAALVRGRRVPLVGRVSMDSVCVDVTDVDGVTVDDEFVLLGTQGNERIAANELALFRGTITNEVLCSFGGRLPRVYREGLD